MTLRLGDLAPDFDAETTEGRIRFHEWMGESWAVLFSHPKNYTPVCTTELGYMAKIKPEFDRRGVKIIGLSVDPVSKHGGWSKDIAATQGIAPNYPLIGDADYTVAKLYDMLPANATGDPAQRSAADNATVRNVFVIGPNKKIQTHPGLSHDHRAQLRRGAARHRFAAADLRAQGRHTRQLAAGRGRDHRRQRERRRSPPHLPRRMARTTPIPAHRPAPCDRPPESGFAGTLTSIHERGGTR
jgi:alkyl hydroperoxide reductase subunit AhpC